MKKLTLLLLIIIFVLMLIGSLLIYGWTRDLHPGVAETAVFAATIEDEAGVDLNSAFRLSFDSSVSSAAVNKALRVTPEIDFGVHQGSTRKEVLVTPGVPLDEDTLYRFSLAVEGQTYTWAVQTQAPLHLAEHRPSRRQTAVPLDAPIDMVLSTSLTVDPDSLAECFQITPQVEGTFEQSGRLLRFVPRQKLSPGTVYTVSLDGDLQFLNSDLALDSDYCWSFETTAERQPWSFSGSSAYTTKSKPSFTLRGISGPGGQSKVTVLASLYAYGDLAAYQEALEVLAANCPPWSNSFRYYSGTDVSGCQQLFSQAMLLEPAADGSKMLALEDPLPAGCYVLRVQYGAESRDQLFMVSDLEAYLLTDAEKALVWTVDANGSPVNASVAELWGGDQTVADKQGLAQLSLGEQGLFSISANGQNLLLPLWEKAAAAEHPNVWRYLYCDKSVYANGDTLSFYGLLTTRDGSKLDYERVSVYILPKGGSPEDAAYRDYAQLHSGIFHGSIALPQLQPGEYSLQIWQSGLLYVEEHFLINEDPNYSRLATGKASASSPLYLEMGEKFSLPAAEGSRLYVEASGGIQEAKVLTGEDYSAVFSPENQLDSYVLAVEHTSSGFFQRQYTELYRSAEQQELQVALNSNPLLFRGTKNTVRLSVQTPDGQQMPQLLLAVQLLLSSNAQPELDPLGAIYGDYEGSGLSLGKGTESATAYNSGKTYFFQVLETDESGQAELEVELPGDSPDGCWLLAQVITCGDGGVYAGSLEQPMEVLGELPLPDDGSVVKESGYAYEIHPLGGSIGLGKDSRLLICGSTERLELLNMLLRPAFATEKNGSAEALFSQSYARQLLVDYGGDSISVLFDSLSLPVTGYQKADGGLGEKEGESSLSMSAKLAAMTPSGISYYALGRYFQHQLGMGLDVEDQAIALAGLASCGQASLRETKALLWQEAEISDYTFCWLLWSLLRNGDRYTAAQLYADRDFQDTQREQALAWRAVVAADLGLREEALSLLEQISGEEYSWQIEQILVARALLTRTEQEELFFTYTAGGNSYEVSVSGIRDYFLSPLALSGDVKFTKVDSGLSYCNIFWVDPTPEDAPRKEGDLK